jgi:radical SAM/Cys-rich protein
LNTDRPVCFRQKLESPLIRSATRVLQINLGRLCNQSCRHCHVGAGPTRTEMMSDRGIAGCLSLMDRLPQLEVVDLTGGAPELHGGFRELVCQARQRNLDVIDRCNLTILEEQGQETLAPFLAEQQVHVIASLPCYSTENVDRQRGDGVFEQSLRGLKRLNSLGYGASEGQCRKPGSLRLDLVFNPGGATLPPPAAMLEADYRRTLRQQHGIVFDRLITITNMPISRFLGQLRAEGLEQEYQQLLVESFNEATLPGLMCRETLSVEYDGTLHDCDFNQMLSLGLKEETGEANIPDLWNVTEEQLRGREIVTGSHCFGCTAGQGSSCGGSLVEAPATEGVDH